MSMLYLILISMISRNVSLSCPRSRLFGFCNSSLINPWSFFYSVTEILFIICRCKFGESNLFHMCLFGFQWGLLCCFISFESKCLESKLAV